MNKNPVPPSILTIMLILISVIIFLMTPRVSRSYEHPKAQIYSSDTTKRITANISLKGPNRINFGSYGIKEVIGDDSKYTLVADKRGGNIFITPKCTIGEIIDLTMVDGRGIAQDLSLIVSDIASQTIIFSEFKKNSEASKIKEAEIPVKPIIAGDEL